MADLPVRAGMMGERDQISEFMKLMKDGPLLSEAETRRLVIIARQAKGGQEREDAFRLLLGRNVSLVAWVARRYLGRGVPAFELMQAGCEGIVAAIERFDPTLQIKFSTYATWWVRQGMQWAIRSNSILYVPSYIQDQLHLIKRTRARFHAEYGRLPSDLEILTAIKEHPETKVAREISLLEVVELRPLLDRRLVSYDAPLSKDDEDQRTIQSFLGVADAAELQADLAALRERIDGVMNKLHARMVSHLSERQRLVLLSRLGWDGKPIPRLEDIGMALDISRERVRQIEKRAWGLLHLPLSKEYIVFLIRIWHNLKEGRSP